MTNWLRTGIARLDQEEQAAVMRRVFTYRDFTPDNDPYGEYDFGSFEHAGKWIMWKIDYYESDVRVGLAGPGR